MQKYFNNVVDANGTAIVGAVVNVTIGGLPATLYSDNGITVQSQPVTTGALGYFSFYAADGRYNIIISGAGIQTITFADILLEDPADGGASQIGFLQAGAGAVSRTVQSKLRDVVSVNDFGTVGDGVADDTAAIQAAWTAAATKPLYFPPGTYRITAALSGPLTELVGAGQGRTIIDCENFSGKDAFTFQAPVTFDRQGGMSGMTIRAKGQSGRYAIVTPRAANLNDFRPKYRFVNLAFTGTVNTTGFAQNFGWTWMIDHGDSWGSVISDIDALGTYIIGNDPTPQAEEGFLRLAGLEGVLSVRLDRITVHNCKNGIEIGDRVFWYFNNVDIAESYKGIYTNRDDLTTIYGEGVIHGVVVNAQFRGVALEDRIATMCNHLTINRANGGFDHGLEWVGLRLEDTNLCNFNNIKIYAGFKNPSGRFTGNQVGIDLVGGKTITISNYTPQALDRCIRTTVSAETSAIPSGITIANVASETNVAGSIVFDFQAARRVQVDNVSWEPATAPAIVAQFGDTTTARNVQIGDTGPLGASATVGVTGRPEYLTDFGAASNEKLYVWVNDNGDLRLQARTDDEATAVNVILINRTGTVIDQTELRGTALKLNNTQTGFYGATPANKPAITGSRAGNAALASLLTQLATLGLITDSTTA